LQFLSNNLRFFRYLFLSLSLFILDFITKYLTKLKFPKQIGRSDRFETIEGIDAITIIDPILIYQRVDNGGIAFGIDSVGNFSYILTPITIILTIAIIVYLYKISKDNKILIPLSFSLILGGALGNLFDRLFYGKVVDFIGLFENIFPFTFNLADTFVTIGMIILLFSELFYKQQGRNGKQQNQNISS